MTQTQPSRCEQSADRHVFVVCTGEHCAESGASQLWEALKNALPGKSSDVRISASKRCIGHCAAAPAMVEDGKVLRWVSLRRLRGELLRLGLS